MSSPAGILCCPVCRREVARRPGSGLLAEAQRASELFVKHAERQHGTSAVNGLLYFAEAMRRAAA